MQRAICLPDISDIDPDFDHPAVLAIEVPDPGTRLSPIRQAVEIAQAVVGDRQTQISLDNTE